jgi:predicted GNAT family acetyltransferase
MAELTFRLLRQEDENALQRLLNSRIESSMFLYNNMQQAGLVDNDQPYQGTYAAAFEGQEIAGVVAHYWNNNLVIQSDDNLGQLIRLAVSGSERPIGGILGIEEQVVIARDILKLGQEDLVRDESQWLYSLKMGDLNVPESLNTDQLIGRRAHSGDLQLLADWRSAYLAEVLGLELTAAMRQDAYRNMQKYIESGRTWMVESGGQPVASSSFNATVDLGKNESIVQVGGVWTPPRHRSKGYGRAAVAASLLDAQEEGANRAILFTADNNVPAQKAYLALGFRRIGSYRLTILRKHLKSFPQEE